MRIFVFCKKLVDSFFRSAAPVAVAVVEAVVVAVIIIDNRNTLETHESI